MRTYSLWLFFGSFFFPVIEAMEEDASELHVLQHILLIRVPVVALHRDIDIETVSPLPTARRMSGRECGGVWLGQRLAHTQDLSPLAVTVLERKIKGPFKVQGHL